jgi:hypothetical protein
VGARVGGKSRRPDSVRPRQIASGGERPAPEGSNQRLECGEDPFVSLAEQGGQDVLADPLAPEVIGAVAPGEVGGVEVHPVAVLASIDAESARADPLGAEPEASLQAVEIDPDSFEVDCELGQAGLR